MGNELDEKTRNALARLEARTDPEPPKVPEFLEQVEVDLRMVVTSRIETATGRVQQGIKVRNGANQPVAPANGIPALMFHAAKFIRDSGATKQIDWKPEIYKAARNVVAAFEAVIAANAAQQAATPKH